MSKRIFKSIVIIFTVLLLAPIFIWHGTKEVSAAKAGWVEQKDGLKYQNSDGTFPKSKWQKISNSWFYFDKKGVVAMGWQNIGGKTYFLSRVVKPGSRGKMFTGWKTIDKNIYYFDASGAMQTGWIKLNSHWYYLEKSGKAGVKGKLLTGWLTQDGKTYFLKSVGGLGTKGRMLTGWRIINNQTYRFESSGAMQTNWVKVGSYWYYFNTTGNIGVKGKMLTGWQTLGGKTYYLKKVGGYGTKGRMFTGTHTISGKKCHFDSSGAYIQTLAERVANTKTAKKTNQIITVAAGKLTLWEKSQNAWKSILSVSCFSGKNGISTTSKEGDYKTPAGAYTMTQSFGRGNNPGTQLPYRKITPNSYWISNVADKDYNTWQERTKSSSLDEHLIDYGVYKYVIVIDYNTKCVPGKGSAIFLHCSNGSPTAGCVSVQESTMLTLMKRVKKGSYIIIGSSEAELSNY